MEENREIGFSYGYCNGNETVMLQWDYPNWAKRLIVFLLVVLQAEAVGKNSSLYQKVECDTHSDWKEEKICSICQSVCENCASVM